MKNNKNLLKFGWLFMFAIATLTITSCDDDEDPTFTAPTIVVTPATTSGLPGTEVSLSIAVTADAKLASVTVNGTSIKTYTDETADAFVHNFAIPATAQVGSSIALAFVVSDQQGTAQTATQNVTVNVGDPGKENVVIEGVIAADRTLEASKYYTIKGNVYVQAPATLTIQPGTIIFGDKVSKASLIINRGAKINAAGTEASPIVFTSSAPATFRNYGDWGGLIILGKAVNNQNATQSIEGVSGATGDDGKYGGTADDDNSGVLQYVRIEFAGIALSTDNEINGLTLGSVGSATTIDHIQVSYSGDDSFEWFGGTVKSTHLIAFKGWDDDFDTDFGFTGSVQYAVSHRDPNIADKSGSNGFESDNDGTGSVKTPLTAPKFANVSWFGPGVYARLSSGALNRSNYNANYQFGGHLRRNSAIQVYNSIFIGSYLETIHFDKTNTAAVFKGNYVARSGVNVSNATMKQTAGNAGGEYVATGFTTDNFFADTQTGVDQTGVIVGLGATNLNVDEPLSLLAGTSTLLTGGATVPTGLTQTTYIGAFDAANDWTAATWVNFTPNATSY